MSGKYGFSDDASPPPQVISLPKPKAQAAKPAAELVADAVRAGEGLGFVSREPRVSEGARRRPGRRQAEPQDKLLIAGPKRVLDAFREYCEREKIPSYWAAIEQLMGRAEGKHR